MSNTDIVVAGHICLDISPEFPGLQNQSIDTLFRPGRLINMAGVSISDGGPVANTGFALARLGLNVLPMAGVGNDDFGSLISAIVQRETGRDIVRRDDIASSYSVILSPPGIDRIILHHPAGNDEFSSRDIDFAEVANAGYFHFGYPPLMKGIFADDGEELKRIYQKAKAVGAITSLDMSLPDVDSDSGKLDWATSSRRRCATSIYSHRAWKRYCSCSTAANTSASPASARAESLPTISISRISGCWPGR